MAKLIVVLINWALTKQLAMIALGTNVGTLMLKNIATFALPDVDLIVLKTATARLQSAYNARKGDANAKLEYINAAIALDALLHTQANYVNYTAKGDASIIGLSGYTASTNTKVKKAKTGAPGAVGTKTSGGGILELTIVSVIFLGTVSKVIVGNNYVRTTTDYIVTKGKLRKTVAFLPIDSTLTILALNQNVSGITQKDYN